MGVGGSFVFSFEITISAFCGFNLRLCLLHQHGWSFVLDGTRTEFLSQELALGRMDHSLIRWNTRSTFAHRGHYVSYILSSQGGLYFENRMVYPFLVLLARDSIAMESSYFSEVRQGLNTHQRND